VDDIYSIAAHQLPFAQNVDLGNPIGSITKRAGRESLFASLGAGQVLGLHAWEHSDGDKLIEAWGKNLYLLSGASGSIAKTSQADWEAGVRSHIDTTTSPGDIQMVTGTDFTEEDTLTADFDGTHSHTKAVSDHVELVPADTAVNGITTLGATSIFTTSGHDEVGWKFTVGAKALTCTKLRLYAGSTGSKTVRLWRVSDKALLASVNVSSVDGVWVEASITPVTIAANTAYVVSYDLSAGKNYRTVPRTSNTYSSVITCNEGRYLASGGGTFPTTVDSTDIQGIVDIVITDAYYNTAGVYTHHEQNISAAREIANATITYDKTTPANTTLTVEARVSTDGGANWGAWTARASGEAIITAGTDVSGYRVQWRTNLASTDGVNTPTLNSVTVSVVAVHYAEGIWESPAYDLGNTPLTATLSWVATTPAGTTVTGYAAGSGNGTVFGDYQELTAIGDAIPLSRFIKVKFVLASPTSTTPTASSLLVSYSTSYTQAHKLDISPLGRTANELTGNRVRMQDYDDRCYCADDLRSFVLYVDDATAVTGTAQAGAATTIRLAAGASAVNDFFNNAFITITGGTGVGQVRFISDYNGSTKDATVAAWTTNPANDSTYAIGSAVKARKAGVDAPAASLTSAAGAGTGLTGNYYYKYTYVNADGYESNPSPASTVLNLSNKDAALSVIAVGGVTIASRKIYRTKAGGSVYYYVHTIADNTTTTYTDAAADGTLTELMLDNNNIPPNASIVFEFLSYMFYANNDELWFSKAGSPEQVPNITGDRTLIVCPSTILDIKSNPMALIPQGENFIAPITTNTGFVFDSDPTIDTTRMKLIDKNGSLSFEASDICIDPQMRSILVFPTNTGVRLLLPGLQEESIESVPLSRNIQTYFDRTVNRGSMAGIFFNSYYILSMEYQDPAKVSSEWLTFCYDFRTSEWYGPWTFGASCYCISGAVLYAGDPAVGKIYHMFSGNSDDGSNVKMVADLQMLSPAGENHIHKFNNFMAMVSAESNTVSTTIAAKVDDREATINLGVLTDAFIGEKRPGHDNIRSKKYKIPLARGSTLSYRITDDSVNPFSLQKIITECTPLPLKG
jgi:hypothetical protein